MKHKIRVVHEHFTISELNVMNVPNNLCQLLECDAMLFDHLL